MTLVSDRRRSHREKSPLLRTQMKGPRLVKAIQVAISFGLALTVWTAMHYLLDLPHYVLPSPQSVLDSLVQGLVVIPASEGFLARQGFYQPLIETLKVTGLGFVIGVGAAVSLAFLMSWFKPLDGLLMPMFTSLKSIPKAALAPLFVLWFGFAQTSRLALVLVGVLFPVLINTRAGLQGVSANRLMMAQSFNATRWRVQRLVSLPSAMPSIMTGLELAVVSSLLAAVLAEIMGGSSGMGARLMQYQYQQAVAPMFAMLILFAIVGSALYALVRFMRRKFVYWEVMN